MQLKCTDKWQYSSKEMVVVTPDLFVQGVSSQLFKLGVIKFWE